MAVVRHVILPVWPKTQITPPENERNVWIIFFGFTIEKTSFSPKEYYISAPCFSFQFKSAAVIKATDSFSFPTATLGKGPATKSDEFLEKFQRGEGSFSIQKFVLHILGTLNRAF